MISPAVEKLSRKYEAAGHLYCLVQLQGADALISPVLGISSSVPYDQLKHSLQVNAQYALSGGKLLDNVMGGGLSDSAFRGALAYLVGNSANEDIRARRAYSLTF